jgi:hypothetical protein
MSKRQMAVRQINKVAVPDFLLYFLQRPVADKLYS